MNKLQYVANIIGASKQPPNLSGEGFASANIALAKYWGKRDAILNVPCTNSLSISLGMRGSYTKITRQEAAVDTVYLNGHEVAANVKFYQQLIEFLDLFRASGVKFCVHTKSNIPIGAGVASSASGFAALVIALNQLFAWNLPAAQLSRLARLGSGSASRSFWPGFVEWQAGIALDGTDSFAEPLAYNWPELRLGLLIFSTAEKPISSRLAMAATVKTCPFYSLWPERVALAITNIKQAIAKQDFAKFALAAENNSLEMHALMLATKPAIIYSTAATIAAMEQVWQARRDGLPVYFTQDAGPNLKLLFLQQDTSAVQQLFPAMEIVDPFAPAELAPWYSHKK